MGVPSRAVAVGEERHTVEEVCEPFLVRAGLLARTPRGRVATEAAWRHLGVPLPRGGLPLGGGVGAGAPAQEVPGEPDELRASAPQSKRRTRCLTTNPGPVGRL